MEKKAVIYRREGFSDFYVKCEEINKFESNIELVNPVMTRREHKNLESLLIPLETIDHFTVRKTSKGE